MTRNEILYADPAQLNDWIDEYIMKDIESQYGSFPNWSGDMSAAWEIVEKFDINKFNLNWLDETSIFGKGWHAKIEDEHAHQCKSAPEAICKAALLATLEVLSDITLK